MRLTKNFTLEELIGSESYPEYVRPPSDFVVGVLRLWVTMVLQPLREHLRAPVGINSGYRNPVLNRMVGGVPNSVHQIELVDFLGVATDIVTKDMGKALHWLWTEAPVSNIIVYPERGFIHIDVRPNQKTKKMFIQETIMGDKYYRPYKPSQRNQNWEKLIQGKL